MSLLSLRCLVGNADGIASRRCCPAYLTEEAHKTLSQPGAFDGLRVHTDEFVEVLARIKPETVTVAVVRPLFSSGLPFPSLPC